MKIIIIACFGWTVVWEINNSKKESRNNEMLLLLNDRLRT